MPLSNPSLGHGGLAVNPTSSSSPSKGDNASLAAAAANAANSLKEASSMLVMSGGEGYIDFRIGEKRRHVTVLL